jgi:hypothetical protein
MIVERTKICIIHSNPTYESCNVTECNDGTYVRSTYVCWSEFKFFVLLLHIIQLDNGILSGLT